MTEAGPPKPGPPDRGRFLDAILDSATDYGIISMDLDGLVTSWNEGAHRILGWTEAEIIGLPASVFFTLEDRRKGAPQGEMETSLRHGRGNDERWHQRKDGSQFWASGEMMPLKDQDGAVQGFIKILRDRTEHRQAEQALQDSNSYVRLLLDSAAAGFYAVDCDGTTTLCNPAFLKMLGFASEADAVGLKLHDVIHHSHPDGSHYGVDECPIYVCARTGTPAHIAQELFFQLDGTSFPVEYWAHPIYSDGELRGAVCSFLDVTDRIKAQAALQASEAQFRALAEALPNQVWSARPDGYTDWFNARVYAYSGAKNGDLDGDGWAQIVHADDAPSAAQAWRAALASDNSYQVEMRLRRADGVYRWHLTRGAPIRDADGAITRWIGSNTDIEDQKAAAQVLSDLNATLERQVEERTAELMQVEEALRQSQKMEAVGQLTGGIAHDFNNLLTGITGALDLIKRRMDAGRTDDLARFMDAASASAQRAAALTHRLLAFARRQSLDTKPSEVNALIIGIEDLLRRSLGEHVELETALAPDLWPALADGNQLENAILNLAINARDAMPGGGKLTIETVNTRLDEAYARTNDNVEPGQYVAISVSDNGSGMSPAVVAKAFEPFFTTKPIGEGTGLGLSMIYGFAKQSGGHVRIYSEENQGTTVKLYLRRAPAGADETPAAVDPAAPRGHGETVLVVEDDPTVRLLVTEVLGELGYRFLEAPDARTAIPLLASSETIDLLVTDVGLPIMNGRQLADIARQHRPDLKILFVTGYAENAALRGDFLAPGMEMLTKPFALDVLGAKIREMIEG